MNNALPVKEHCLQWLKESQKSDPVCIQLRKLSSKEWPSRRDMPEDLKPFFEHRHQLTVEDDLLLYAARVVVPVSCRKEIMRLLHEGHFGITKTQARSKDCVWWPKTVVHAAALSFCEQLDPAET